MVGFGKRAQPYLRRFQLFQRRPHAVLAELFFSHQKRHHAFLVRSRELQLQAFAIRHVRVFEKLPRFVERPVLGDDVFRRVDVLAMVKTKCQSFVMYCMGKQCTCDVCSILPFND